MLYVSPVFGIPNSQCLEKYINTYSLPSPSPDQAFVKVSALEAGHVRVKSSMIIEGSPHYQWSHCPSPAFLLEHSKSKKKFFFDLGMRKNLDSLPSHIRENLSANFPVDVPQSAEESLKNGGVDPKDIELIFLSHLHFDHIGNSEAFPSATFRIAQGSQKLLDEEGMAFALPPERTELILDTAFNQSIGPFSRALDYFGDGSVYLLDAFGHELGHMNLLARTSPDGAWICLAGDSCHHPSVLRGEKTIPRRMGENGVPESTGMYRDLQKTEEHIKKLQALRDIGRVHVMLAHDVEWYNANTGTSAFFPGLIPPCA